MLDEYRQFLKEGEQAGMMYTLSSPRYLPMGIAGSRVGNRAGSSLEFKEHREYELGDDLRRIDWGVYARSDKLAVKLYREEVSPHLDLVLDGSHSMALDGSAKAQAALGLAAVFTVAASNAGYSHTAWLAREGCERIENGAARPATWENIDFGYSGSLMDSLARFAPQWHPQGIRILLSDLLWLGDPLPVLSHFRDRASMVVVVQILAAGDVNPPEHGYLRLLDIETGELREIFIDAVVQKRYREALHRHQENWHLAARQTGAVLLSVVAEEIVRDWKLSDLVAAEVLK